MLGFVLYYLTIIEMSKLLDNKWWRLWYNYHGEFRIQNVLHFSNTIKKNINYIKILFKKTKIHL